MKIKKMTAHFGKLSGAVLAPGPGLTVIAAPNEGGKSTWCAFLKAMLYGLDTRERDKAGALAEKNHYQPWSGTPMSGQLELEWQGRDITLRRASTKAGLLQGFKAVYTASGDPVPGLTAANAGQALIGAGREVFVRCALLAQNDGVLTAAPELEQRIAALATAGQEDASFSATQRTLKGWRNRRQANRSTGLIPQLKGELDQTQAKLQAMEQARVLRDQARAQLAKLDVEQAELTSQLEIHRRLAQKDLNRRYAQALEALARAQTQLDELPQPDPEFAGLTPRQAREQARLAMAEPTSREGRRRSHSGTQFPLLPGVLLLGAGGLASLMAGLTTQFLPGVILGSFLLLLLLLLLIWNHPTAGQEAPAIVSPLDRAEAYADYLALRDRLADEVRHCRERVEDLRAQGGREMDTLEFLQPPDRSLPETQRLLEHNRQEAARWQSQLDRADGALQTDPLALEAHRDELQRQLEERGRELTALNLALEGLEAANTVLRERFSPALNQKAAEIFSALTGGKYNQVTLRRDFSALAGEEAQPLHSGLYLSAGTADQLYLAVRLALSQLTLPGIPLVLDDILATFDDHRAALALDYLARLGKERQILLFSCHSREAQWARAHQIPVLTLS